MPCAPKPVHGFSFGTNHSALITDQGAYDVVTDEGSRVTWQTARDLDIGALCWSLCHHNHKHSFRLSLGLECRTREIGFGWYKSLD